MWTVIENPNAGEWTFPVGADKFIVVNGDEKAGGTWPTAKQAQVRADALNNDEDGSDFLDEWLEEGIAYDEDAATRAGRSADTVVEAVEPEEKIGLDGQYEVGQEVTVDGCLYVVEQAFYTDAQAATYLDDANDTVIPVGWHANARRKY